mgnify:CR=1 FL=1
MRKGRFRVTRVSLALLRRRHDGASNLGVATAVLVIVTVRTQCGYVGKPLCLAKFVYAARSVSGPNGLGRWVVGLSGFNVFPTFFSDAFFR